MGRGAGRKCDRAWVLGEGRAAGLAQPRPCKSCPDTRGSSLLRREREGPLPSCPEPLEPGPEPERFWAPRTCRNQSPRRGTEMMGEAGQGDPLREGLFSMGTKGIHEQHGRSEEGTSRQGNVRGDECGGQKKSLCEGAEKERTLQSR